MDSSIFLTILAAAIGFFLIFRKFRFHQENQEIDPSSSSPTSPSSPSSATSPSSPTSSLSPSSATSSSSHNWIHDVFPSFRGEDVRRDFLSHIQKEFGRKGITPFIDNEIKRGESIGPELKRAIRGSKIAIILLSKNYASSKWCLDELVEIMKCREKVGQTVMAIFYKVDPSNVKKLTGDFGKVFKKTCAGKSKEDIERWRQALVKVATIAGYDSSNWDNEAAMIEKIATDVSNKLINSAPSSDFDGLVGMRDHMENMNLFLRLDSNEVKMIGIWGPSGIGKSTIARVLYSKHSHQFQFSVFMENIKRRYVTIHGYDEYSAKLQLQKDRLKDKRVLVVLDDVDHLMQLNAMAERTGWFGPGSRIIITTQDKRLLNAHGINHIYEVDFPSYKEALEILCMYAFGQKSPHDGFENLAWEVTQLAGKLPLGLRVMGSYLKGRPREEWKRELPRLRTSLDGEIESILEFSYNALRAEDKELFLYIACFFNNEQIEKVEYHLAKNFSHVSQGLQVLAEKSLISISSGDIEMHDLLARFGREIVRRQSIHDPGQRQFLVDARETCQVLSNCKESRGSVIGAIINFSEIENELNRSEWALERLSSLQFLRLHDGPYGNSYIPQSLNNLPRKVRLLHWKRFPLTCMPSNFNPEFLVELNMPNSSLEKLWEGIKTIRNLKWMDLSFSKNLMELSDLSTAINLEELNLRDCSNLEALPSSIGNAINLKKLDLSDCSSLVELPSSIGNATNLKELNLSGCSSLVELPSSIGNATNLKELNLRDCSNLVELPYSIGNAINLEELTLSGCERLVELPSSIGNAIKLERLSLSGCSNLVALPYSIGNINLWYLDLNRCSRLVELPSSIGNAINLHKLDLTCCSSLVLLPSSIGNAINLEELTLNGCSSLVELPSSIGNATNLKKLDLSDCSSLVELPSSIGNAINLEELDLSDCSSLVELPSSIGNATNLEKLDLTDCSSLVELPSSIGNAINLEKLNLSGCSSLVELPSSIGNAIKLNKLDLRDCSSLVELPSSIGNAANLEELVLTGCSNLVKLPVSIGNAIKLKKLLLADCSNLVEFPSLNNSIYLKELDLRGCYSLVELPISIGNATNLKELYLSSCSSLVELPFSIRNIVQLKKIDFSSCSSLIKIPFSIGNVNVEELDLRRCSSLMELPSSIGNAIKLKKLDLRECSSLVELPTSLGNITNLKKLYLSGCSSLVELPSSIGNITNLKKLYLSECSSLVKLPSSIGNLHNLSRLHLQKCSKLEALPININMESLDELYLTNCSMLKIFPEISTNIRVLMLNGTAIEEIPSSIRLWSRLDELHMSYCEKLEQLDLSCCSNLVELPSSIGNAINLEKLDLSGCSSLVELPTSLGNITNLENLFLNGCSSLVRLPSSIGNLRKLSRLHLKECSKLEALPVNINMESLDELDLTDCLMLKIFPVISTNIRDLMLNGTAIEEIPSSIRSWSRLDKLHMSYCEKLEQLDFSGCSSIVDLSRCSSLVELPSSIGNAINLQKLDLSGCSSLVELSSSIGNITSLMNLDLSGCSSLVKLPSSIGNLHKLMTLRLKGCSKLEALLINIKMESLDELDLSDCSMLKSFPDISTNIRDLMLNGTAIKDIPSSIRLWSRLDKLQMSYWENLGELSHIFNFITELHLSDKRTQEIAPWVKELSRLEKLVIKGCTKLVSLPQLPDSLRFLDAENCESLERLHFSFQNNKFFVLNFGNCFKLNQEARDLIITSSCEYAVLPGEKVPAYFTDRATGSSCIVHLQSHWKKKFEHFTKYLTFKGCVLLVNKGDVEVGNGNMLEVSHCITEKLKLNDLWWARIIVPRLKKHMYLFETFIRSESIEFVFEIIVDDEKLEIGECGIRTLKL